MTTATLGPFLGLNNRLPDFALHKPKEGNFVRAADNVDLNNAGSFVRRKADTLAQAISGTHSLYDGYLVRDSVLYQVTLPAYSETLIKALTSNAPMSYVAFGDSLYFANGTDCGRIKDGACYPMAVPTPASPTVSILGGTLFAGTYQVAVQYMNQATGEEGGVSPSTAWETPPDAALRITLPGPMAGATHVNVYVSAVNGSIPLLQATVPANTPLVDIAGIALGREANQRCEAPLPAGRLFLFNGCLCSYKDGNVYEGLPFRPGYYLPIEGRIPFPATVTNVVPAQNGVYVVADKTYWLAGPRMTACETIRDVLPYGGVPGTAFAVPHKSLYGWFGEKGIVLGTPSGDVQAVMSDNVDVTPPVSGFSTVFEDRGYRRVVSCGYCLNLDNLGVTTYSDWGFTSVSGEYGTKADGLYQVGGAGPAPYVIDFGKQDFGTDKLKHMPACYLGGSSDEAFQLRVQTPEHDYTYAARASAADLRVQRVDPGKGLRANWFNLSLIGEADFTLASVSFAPVASTRRI